MGRESKLIYDITTFLLRFSTVISNILSLLSVSSCLSCCSSRVLYDLSFSQALQGTFFWSGRRCFCLEVKGQRVPGVLYQG